MSPWLILVLLPVGALYAYAAGRLATGLLGTREPAAVPPIMALSALAHLMVSSLLALGPTLALLAFWSASHLAALPFVARGLRTGA
ncbi:hypothetical protein [Plastoroseomonas arctica]|uniref:Uncharacterized protein n=1 Tax=Plastoroseomonas arctica TaxID=1509237 RepID=A0AAF1KHA2_9PROT|nr:hypothetical protein [Plastoroseomonas arctica]MBR0653699.1 hypothetical protein [Plastoroseomonas arctica]